MLDVIVVNWNANDMLVDCVMSVLQSQNVGEWLSRIVVVDNASTDTSLQQLEALCDARVHIIKNERNLGFGRACNLGSRLGNSELILFLNPDVVLEPNALTKAIQVMCHGDDNIGVCGIKLITRIGEIARTCARKPTAWNMTAYALGFGRKTSGGIKTYMMSEWDHCESMFVHHVIGAFYLIRRSVFEGLGGFDERFFMYLEDLDLSTRIADAGLKCRYVGEVRAIHEGGGTSKQIQGRRLFYAIRSRLQYANKHFGIGGAFLVSVSSAVIEPPLRLIVLLLRRDVFGVRNALEAYGLVLKWLIGSVGTRGKRVHESGIGSSAP